MDNYDAINLGALKRRDSSIVGILAASGHCILYNFDTANTKWMKTEIEGNLYIFSRNVNPQFGFTLMNTKHQDNFTQVISTDMGLQLNFPYLLYKNNQGIYAVWFYDKEDSSRMYEALKQYQKMSSRAQLTSGSKRTKTSSPANGVRCVNGTRTIPKTQSDSILNMLNAADGKNGCIVKTPHKNGIVDRSNVKMEKNSTGNIPSCNRKVTSNHRKSPPVSSGNSHHSSAFVPVMTHRSKSMDTSVTAANGVKPVNVLAQSSCNSSPDKNENLHPLLVQMFSKNSNPQSSSEPPKLSTQAADAIMSQEPYQRNSLIADMFGSQPGNGKVNPVITLGPQLFTPDSKKQGANNSNRSHSTIDSRSDDILLDIREINNNVESLSIDSDEVFGSSPRAAKSPSSSTGDFSSSTAKYPSKDRSISGSPFVSDESLQALQLMAPSHFMSDDEMSNHSGQSLSPAPLSPTNPAAVNESSGKHVTNGESAVSANGDAAWDSAPECERSQHVLSPAQMQQALLYLIKNDETFMKTLHHAYVQSVASGGIGE